MARVFRATYTKLRTVKDRKGKVVYDVKDGKDGKDGKKVPRRVPVLGKDGKPVQAESRKWYVEYKDANGRTRRKAGYTDLKATEQLAAELDRTAERVRSGYRPKEHEHLARPLAEHLADWQEAMRAKGTSERQVQQVHNRAKRIMDDCGFIAWGDITAAKAQKRLAELRKDTEEKRGISAQTSNWYLQAAKGFCEWLVRENRAPENPLSYLEGLNVKADRRHDRRALTPDECKKLLAAAASGPTRWKMTGPERALLYRMVLESGLRAGEARTLTVGACRLEDDPPVLIVKAAYSKHRREDHQPIPADLASDMATFLTDRSGDDLVFPTMPNRHHTAKMLRADLEATGIPYRDSAGLVADFHSLRHSYISNLARAGVHPKTAMDLARHSDINLTMARYSHTVIADRAQALTDLPDLTGTPSEAERAKATGTYDRAPVSADQRPQNAKQNANRRPRGSQQLAVASDTPSVQPFAKPVYGSYRTAGSNPALSVTASRAATSSSFSKACGVFSMADCRVVLRAPSDPSGGFSAKSSSSEPFRLPAPRRAAPILILPDCR